MIDIMAHRCKQKSISILLTHSFLEANGHFGINSTSLLSCDQILMIYFPEDSPEGTAEAFQPSQTVILVVFFEGWYLAEEDMLCRDPF